jgi:SAM-dependent methyltransferase
MTFRNAEESHAHSLQTLNVLYEHDDFMSSIDSVIDLGCGSGMDLEWWATRTTRDNNPISLNIDCTGVDLHNTLSLNNRHTNVRYQQTDFENNVVLGKKNKFDILWCHDAFQYAIDPIGTLSHWWNIANDNAMLIIVVPQTTIMAQRSQAFYQPSGCYYHHTMVSLMHMLAVTGWDCASGFFLKRPNDAWIHAAVYKSDQPPMDPQQTSWYDLIEKKLLPESAETSIMKHGYLRQQDLTIPWLDKNLTWMGHQ